MYPEGSVSMPQNFMPSHPLAKVMGSPATLRDEALAPTPRTPHAVDVHRREYYAIISHLDTQIGRVLDAIEASGAADNTVIFFAGDNGLAVGRHGLFGKQNMYDHSVRVPLAVAGPGLPRGERRDTLVYMQDLTSTCLDLAGATPFESTAYRSLMPAIRDPAAPGRAHLYSAYLDNARMVRDAAHKLVVIPSAAKAMLFDLVRDPLEMNDLSEDSALRPIARRLFAELLRQQTATGDTLDLSGAFPDLESSDKGRP
jgi:choline-sulfatase